MNKVFSGYCTVTRKSTWSKYKHVVKKYDQIGSSDKSDNLKKEDSDIILTHGCVFNEAIWLKTSAW